MILKINVNVSNSSKLFWLLRFYFKLNQKILPEIFGNVHYGKDITSGLLSG